MKATDIPILFLVCSEMAEVPVTGWTSKGNFKGAGVS